MAKGTPWAPPTTVAPANQAQVLGTILGYCCEETAARELQQDANAPCAKWGKMNFTPRQSDFYHVNDRSLLIMSAAVKWGPWMFSFQLCF